MKTAKKACALTMAAALFAAVSTGAPAQDTAPYNPLLTRRG